MIGMKLFATILAAFMIFAEGSVLAAVVRNSETGFSISGTAEEIDREIPVFVIIPEKSWEQMTEGNAKDTLAYAGTVNTGANGEYNIDIPLKSDCKPGLYMILAGNSSEEFYFAGIGDKQNAAAVFTSGNKDAIFDYLKDEERYYGLNSKSVGEYKKYYSCLDEVGQKMVCERLKDYTYSGNMSTVAELDLMLNNFNNRFVQDSIDAFGDYGFSVIKNSMTSENCISIIESYNDAFCIDMDRVKDLENEEEISARIYNAIKNDEMLTSEQLAKKCYEQASVVKINKLTSRTAGILTDIFSVYNEVYGDFLTNSGFWALPEASRNGVLITIANDDFSSADEIKSAVTNAISTIQQQNVTPSTGHGGGGGSSFAPIRISPQPNKTEQDNEEIIEKNEFVDIKEYGWAKDAIEALAAKGIVSGVGANKFLPGKYISREEWVAMLMNASGIKVEHDDSHFTDVKTDMWYVDYVVTAYKLGIINGKTDNLFGINENITRQDLAVMLNNTISHLGLTLPNNKSVTLADEDEISDYAKEAVANLCSYGVISGKENGNFAPKDFATRAEAARMLYEYMRSGGMDI